MLLIDNLSHAFGSHLVLDHLNLSFGSGTITGIVGQNGVGKTTLFRIMSNIYPVQSGQITLDGSKITPEDIVFMPTDPYFYPFMKGKEYIKIVANNDTQVSRAIQYANALSLPLEDLVDNYSTGMRKKLAFSALFALDKKIIILDEPYNGVDLESNEIIKHIIQSHVGHRIVLLSSHILSTITDICHNVYHLATKNEINHYPKSDFDKLQLDLDRRTIEKLKEIEGM